MTACAYAFRVGNVVANVFVAQGPVLEAEALTPADVAAIARRAAARIEAAGRPVALPMRGKLRALRSGYRAVPERLPAEDLPVLEASGRH